MKFPHTARPEFYYAYVHTYSSYHQCLEWIRDNAREHANVCGDPATQLYRFGFVSSKDYTNFLLVHSDRTVQLEDVGNYTI